MTELDQLRGIFPDRSDENLRTLLLRHGNNVGDAAEAILEDGNQSSNSGSASQATRHTVVQIPTSRQTPKMKANNDTSWWDSPTICTPPPARPLTETAQERRRIMLEAQQLAKLKEESELEMALKASMAPSDKGRLAGHGDLTAGQSISNDALEELMRNPAFVAQLDDDLRVAIELQQQLDYEEQQSQVRRVDGSSSDRLGASVRKRLLSVGASFLRGRSSQDERLAEQLEAINRTNERDLKTRLELEHVKKEAEAACMKAIKDHLASFLEEHPQGTYEAWIEELHPENAENGALLEGMSKTIDFRFYVEDSDHRMLWNDNVLGSSRQYVPAKHWPGTGIHGGAADLLAEESNQRKGGAPTCRFRDEQSSFRANLKSASRSNTNEDLISFDG